MLEERSRLGYGFVSVRACRIDWCVEWFNAELEPIPSGPWAVAYMFMLDVRGFEAWLSRPT
ncbi:MAG: hypothetical protein DRJ69_06490 [Thermoprotei archaeon]|nr:MAG: hypothetical protein DRJ69_06490 [Thermoprotei archaeon]